MAPKRLSTPRAAGFAGVVFALLFGTALVLIRLSLPDGATHGSQWVSGEYGMLRAAALLVPFSGIAFLWFIGVVRDGLGRYEDKFFSTVFLGSGLLFLAMVFAAAAVGVALAAGSASIGDGQGGAEFAAFGAKLVTTLSNTYALRMGGVFMMSLATIWLKTRLMPRWLVVTTYVLALVLLIGSDVNPWLTLAFPAWVLLVSADLLVHAREIKPDEAPRPGTS